MGSIPATSKRVVLFDYSSSLGGGRGTSNRRIGKWSVIILVLILVEKEGC